MVDPATIGVIITGLVGAYKAYTEYRAARAAAQQHNEPAPLQNAEASRGEQTAPIVQAAIQHHGDAKEQTTLALFESDPATFQEALERVLIQLADRSPEVAAALRSLAGQGQNRGVQHNRVTVDNHGVVYGAVLGVNNGTLTSEYNVNQSEHDQRSD